MPIINEDEDQTKNKENSIGGGTSYIGGGTGAGTGAPVAPQQNPQQGTGFSNLQNYLGGSSGDQMAGKIANRQDELGYEAMGNINTYSQDAEKQTAAGTNTYDASVGSGWARDAQSNKGTVDAVLHGMAAPTVSFTGQQPIFEGKLPDSATSIGSFGAAQQAASKSNEWGALSGTESGISTQLKDLYGSHGYSPTSDALDVAITKSGKGDPTLAGSQKKWGGISGMLSGAQEHAQGDIVGAQAQNAKVNAQWAQAAKNAQTITDTTNNIYGRAAKDYTDAQNANKAGAAMRAKAADQANAPKPVSPNPAESGVPKIIRSPQPIAPVGTLAIDPTLQAIPGVDYVPYDRSKEEKDPNKFPQIGQFMIN